MGLCLNHAWQSQALPACSLSDFILLLEQLLLQVLQVPFASHGVFRPAGEKMCGRYGHYVPHMHE